MKRKINRKNVMDVLEKITTTSGTHAPIAGKKRGSGVKGHQ